MGVSRGIKYKGDIGIYLPPTHNSLISLKSILAIHLLGPVALATASPV
jgi:hypothetical protein